MASEVVRVSSVSSADGRRDANWTCLTRGASATICRRPSVCIYVSNNYTTVHSQPNPATATTGTVCIIHCTRDWTDYAKMSRSCGRQWQCTLYRSWLISKPAVVLREFPSARYYSFVYVRERFGLAQYAEQCHYTRCMRCYYIHLYLHIMVDKNIFHIIFVN